MRKLLNIGGYNGVNVLLTYEKQETKTGLCGGKHGAAAVQKTGGGGSFKLHTSLWASSVNVGTRLLFGHFVLRWEIARFSETSAYHHTTLHGGM